jgi:hypothetical protein
MVAKAARSSSLPFVVGTISASGASVHASNGARIALGGAGGHEVAPGPGMPCLLNRLSLDCELSLEGSGFHSLPERQLPQQLASIAS